MRTEFILGDAAQDFEKAVAERTAEFIKDDPLNSVLIMTPALATSSTEQMILKALGERLGTKGIMGVDISSDNRTAAKILSETCGNLPKTLSAAGKSMAVKEILNANEENIKSLIARKSSKDLPSMLVKTIKEFKNQNITPEILSSISTDNKRIKDKLNDLTLIFSKYNEKTAGYEDTEDRLQKAAEYADKSEYLKNTDVIIYGFNSISKCVADLIKAIMRNAKSTTITLLQPDKNAPDKSVYDISLRMQGALENTAKEGEFIKTYLPDSDDKPKKSVDIIYTAKNLFSRKPAKEAPEQNGSVKIGKAGNIKEEVDGAIAQIVKLNIEKGVPYNKIALVCGKSSAYLPVIKYRFKKAGVPCYTGEKRSVAASNLASFVITAFKLSIAGKLSKNLILEHAAAGFTNISDSQRYKLENYAYEKIVSGFAFFEEFKDKELEDIRKKLIQPVKELRDETKKAKNTADWIECVKKYLEKLNLKTKLQQKINLMIEKERFEDADYHEQAYKRISDVLNEAETICGGSEVGKEFIGVLESGLAAEEISVIPQTGDEICCGDIYNLYIPDADALFILGMNMGSIPDYKNETGVLTEKERELVFNADEEFNPANRAEIRKLNILKAFARPNDYIYLSYTENASDKPSLLMDRISEMNPQTPVSLAEIAPVVKSNAKEFTERRLRSVADGLPVDEWGEKFEQAIYTDEELSGEVEGFKKIKAQAGYKLKLNKNTAEKLYGTEPLSVTKTESFYKCPYNYFIKYGLNLKELNEAEVSNIERGIFAHKILEEAAKKIRKSGKGWDEIGVDELNIIIDESKAIAVENTDAYKYSKANEIILNGITEAVKQAAENVRKFAQSGALKPFSAEEEFDESIIRGLKGKVDRIDTGEYKGEKYFGIIDYKTSTNYDFNIDKFYGGLTLQLIFYLMAVELLLDKKYIPAGAAYFEVIFGWKKDGKDPNPKLKGFVGVDKDEKDALYGNSMPDSDNRRYTRDDIAKLITYADKLRKEAGERASSGDISITPAVYKTASKNEKCGYCEYRSICFKDKDDKTGDRIIQQLGKDEVLKRIYKESEESGEENEVD